MKKLGKKFSFLTKIMLVIGLLISNLSSLSIVFAYEPTGALGITLVDDTLKISYSDELAEEVETVKVNIYENYTYLDNTSEEEVERNYSFTSEEFMALEELEHVSILAGTDSEVVENIEVFDGLYEVKVEITDVSGEVIDSAIYSENITHESGIEVSLYDVVSGEEIVPSEDGRYLVDYTSPEVKAVARVLSGGLKPTDMFSYEDTDYMAYDLLSLEFVNEMDFDGHLYGDYVLPVSVELLQVVSVDAEGNATYSDVNYLENLNVLYGTYDINTLAMNMAVATEELALSESYVFYGDTKDGVLYVLLNATKTNTMLDLYRIANFVFEGDEYVTYLLSNSEYEDVLASYDETTGETLEGYLESILLDDTAMLSLVNEGLTVTYKVVVAGDTNNDNALTEEDLLELVNQVIGETEVNTDKSDLVLDGTVDTLDVMYLDQVMKNETWNVEITEEDATLEARLDVTNDDIVSGDEFTVNYVLTLTDYAVNGVSGLFNYDETMLELVSVETANEWLGNSKDGRFLYLGNESLTGTVTENEDGEEVVNPEEYVVVTATFKALKAGTSTVSVETPEYFNQAIYLVLEEMTVSTDVVVNASDNNNLSSLMVAGQSITLEEDVLDYEITVSNDVTTIDVEAIVENVAASVTSIVYPEELVEGENTVTIVVTSENGNEKVYTITVIREEAETEEETTTTQMNYSNYEDTTDDEDDDTSTSVTVDKDDDTDVEEDDTEEESNLSRIIIIILILLVIAGLIYLIFKDEDDEETKKTNKDINRLKKEEVEVTSKTTSKSNNTRTNSNNKNKSSNNKKKER